MSESIKVTYAGVEITYLEDRNVWNFEVRGREHNLESLAKAKERIATSEKAKKKDFSRISALKTSRYSLRDKQCFEKVIVTSIAERNFGGAIEVWIKYSNGDREKARYDHVYQDSEENNRLAAEYQNTQNTIDRLRLEQERLQRQMKTIEVPKE